MAFSVGLPFIFQADQELRAEHMPGIELTDFVGLAPSLCIAGGALAMVGSAPALRPMRGRV